MPSPGGRLQSALTVAGHGFELMRQVQVGVDAHIAGTASHVRNSAGVQPRMPPFVQASIGAAHAPPSLAVHDPWGWTWQNCVALQDTAPQGVANKPLSPGPASTDVPASGEAPPPSAPGADPFEPHAAKSADCSPKPRNSGKYRRCTARAYTAV
jgi:hypothetical protein